MQTIFQRVTQPVKSFENKEKINEKLEKVIEKGSDVLSEMRQTIQEAKAAEIQANQKSPPEGISKNEKQKFNELVAEGPNVLLTINSVFPFDLFPDRLLVDSVKVTLIHNIFFNSNQIRSITIKDIKFVTIENGPLFSTLRISDNMLQPTVFVIKPLWRKEAQKIHDIIQGLVSCEKKQIDNTKITPREQLPQLEELGKLRN